MSETYIDQGLVYTLNTTNNIATLTGTLMTLRIVQQYYPVSQKMVWTIRLNLQEGRLMAILF